MKILVYDCFSGISGDMNLGAMIDLGVDKDFLIMELGKLRLNGWKLTAETDHRHGIKGTKVTVTVTHKQHSHRHLSDIQKIIQNSDLDEKTKKLSNKIFLKVAEAESKVHGISLDEVHFHEVGAVDSIIDIVGAAVCFNSLGVGEVYILPVELGGGFAKCDHGILPVPAPATAEILSGYPVKSGAVDFEATTPTGAAILTALGTRFGHQQNYKILKAGYGVGHKDHHDVPNLLRVFIAEEGESAGGHDAMLLECNIDDMNPEFYQYITEKLFTAGASDVYISNIIMKKGRPGCMLNVICENGSEEALKKIIFTESTSLGIRSFPFKKDTLIRKFDKVKTEYGVVTVKRSFYKGSEVSYKPEFEDCRKIASEKGIPVKEVYDNIIAILAGRKKK